VRRIAACIAFSAAAACGGDEGASGPALTASASFTVTSIAGSGTSPLDPLMGQTIDFEIVWQTAASNHGVGDDPAGCKTTAVGFGTAERTARGATADLVQREILDKLDNWSIGLQLCDASAGRSSVTLDSTIDELNLGFGCFGLPDTAKKNGSDGYPAVTSFTATECSATILDVVNNRALMNASFAMTIDTGPAQLP
jgi:hypothetical protein